jgi:hypothetical protein
MELELRKIFEDRSELVINFIKSFLIPLKNSTEFKSSVPAFDSDPFDSNFDWITDDDPYVSHSKIIDYGASGEVHRVRFNMIFADG